MTSVDKKFEVESDVRTLREALEIVNDKKRYTTAIKEAGRQEEQLGKVSSLRSALIV